MTPKDAARQVLRTEVGVWFSEASSLEKSGLKRGNLDIWADPTGGSEDIVEKTANGITPDCLVKRQKQGSKGFGCLGFSVGWLVCQVKDLPISNV